MARRSVSPAVVFLRGPRTADRQPDECTVLLRLFARSRLGHRYVAQYPGQLVCERQQQSNFSTRFECKQGGLGRATTGEVSGAGAIHARPSRRGGAEMEPAI